MENRDWMEEVSSRAKEDEWYQYWLKDVKDLEPAFLAIRASLTEEQQARLDDYIAACESLEGARTLLAYQLGREHGMRVVIGPGRGNQRKH